MFCIICKTWLWNWCKIRNFNLKIRKINSGDDLANLDAAAGGGVTERTKNLQMKRFEAFVNFIDEVDLEEKGQGKFIVSL